MCKSYVNGYKYDFFKIKSMVHGVSVQTFDNTVSIILFVSLSIPPFLQFLDCNSQMNMFSRVRSFNMFLLRKICQYLKLNTCLWWCIIEWHNLELKPKRTSKNKMEMLRYLQRSTMMAHLLKTNKSRRTVYKK